MDRDSYSLTSIVEEGGTEGGSGLLDQVKLTMVGGVMGVVYFSCCSFLRATVEWWSWRQRSLTSVPSWRRRRGGNRASLRPWPPPTML